MSLPDNYSLWSAHDDEMEERRMRLPKCSCCHEHIQQEKAVRFGDKWFCEECEDEAWEKIKEEFMEEVEEE